MELRLEANKAYHEIEIFDGKTKIGEAEIEVVENMLSQKTENISLAEGEASQITIKKYFEEPGEKKHDRR